MHAIPAQNFIERARECRDVCLVAGLEPILVIKSDSATVYTQHGKKYGAVTFAPNGTLVGRVEASPQSLRDNGRVRD